MSPDRWSRLQALFHAVREASPPERAALLAAEPDADLRREAQRLLAAHDDAGSFIERPALVLNAPPDDAAEEPAEDVEGVRVGPWEIVHRIGRGGMGDVYLAERAHGGYRQRAALKLVRRGMDSEAVLARFRQERQILATLDHPGVARLLDGGIAEGDRFDGRPYFAMEYVEGEPITAYCDRLRLPVTDRLRLFADVGAAVDAAHRRLVVHRDLKPSNILVAEDAAGRACPKLLDFGIAKLLDPPDDPGGDGAPLTQTGVRVLTPEYAAPEQVRGDAVTTSTDVYGLGVVLYELLTGRRPISTAGRSVRDVERDVLETEPERPSTAVTHASGSTAPSDEAIDPAHVAAARQTAPERLQKTLAGDLDAVCLKALRKEPDARYTGADAFVEDVKRYLAGLPVEARRGSRSYRARKFLARHRGALTTAALLVVLVAGFGALYTVRVAEERDRARAEAERARLEAAKAEQVVGLLTDVFTAADPFGATGPDVPAGRLLETGLANADEALADQPEVLASLLAVAGDIELSWGRHDPALRLLERALALADSAGASSKTRRDVISRLAAAYVDAGRYDAAEPLQREVLALEEATYGPDALPVATAANDLARIFQRKGQFTEAEVLYGRAIAIRRAAGDRSPDLGANLNNLAGLLSEQGRDAEAIPLLQETLLLVEETLGPDHLYAAYTLNTLGLSQRHAADVDTALASYDRAYAIARDQLGDIHPFTQMVLYNRASTLDDAGPSAEALEAHATALAGRRRTLPEGHPELAYNLTAYGRLLAEAGRADEAEALLREAVAIREAAFPSPHWLTAISHGALGRALTALGRFAEADRSLRASYRVLRTLPNVDEQFVERARADLVTLYTAWDRPLPSDEALMAVPTAVPPSTPRPES